MAPAADQTQSRAPLRTPGLVCAMWRLWMPRRPEVRAVAPVYAGPAPMPPPEALVYCNSLRTSCCEELAWASAEMPVWLRISYFDMFELAAA